MWDRLPLGPFSDFAHFVGRFAGIQDATTERRLLQQGVYGVAASGGIIRVFVVGAVEPPFGAEIQNVFAYFAALLVQTCWESVVHNHQDGVASGAQIGVGFVDAVHIGWCCFVFIVEDFPDFQFFSICELCLLFLGF